MLIELACPGDYQMLTQKIENQNAKKLSDLRNHLDELEKESMIKDREATSKIGTLSDHVTQLTLLVTELTDKKQLAECDLKKVQIKLEEEVRLRLFFEEKLNSLYRVNMEEESKALSYKEKMEKMEKRCL